MSGRKDPGSFILGELRKRELEQRLRIVLPSVKSGSTIYVERMGRTLINFCSNDYLGLADHPELTERSIGYTRQYGTGASSSRLISGTLDIHEELEQKIARSTGFEAALLFNSGFQANLSILPALGDRHSLILIDKLCHNSLIQGAMLSRATIKRFRHNDTGHLTHLIQQAAEKGHNRVIVVTETVFSMDGDMSPIGEIRRICSENKVMLYSDDAHAFGIFGENGMGLNEGAAQTDIALGTFGKSAGSFGAFAACSNEMKQYLINFAYGFIYSTALPPSVIGALDAAFDLIPGMEAERKQLLDNVGNLRNELRSMGYDTGPSESQILPVIIGDEADTLRLSDFLEDHGCWVSAIRPPTVPGGSSRIRITLSASHRPDDIKKLTDAFRAWKNR